MNAFLKPRRLAVAALVLAAAVGPPGVAYGNSLTGTNREVAAGFSAVSACHTMTSATLAWTVKARSKVMAAEVSGLPAGCDGASARITLADSSFTSLAAAGTVTVSGGSAVFSTLSANPDPAVVTTTYFSLVGP